jgi:hypothetical protein
MIMKQIAQVGGSRIGLGGNRLESLNMNQIL